MATRTVANLTAIISANNTQFKKGLDGAKKQLTGFQKQISSLKSMIVGAFAVTALARFGQEAFKLAGQLQGVEAAFMNLNKADLLDNLRKATRGTVSDLELMKAAVQAKNFKVPLDQLATYFEFATKRAIQTGESVDYLVESIITGIGRKSVMIMDNLGISAVELQEEVKRLGDFGQAAGEIINRELEKMGEVASTTSTEIQQLATDWENLKVKVGEGLGEVYVAAKGLGKFAGQMGHAFAITEMNLWIKKMEQAGRLIEAIQQIQSDPEQYKYLIKYSDYYASAAERAEELMKVEKASFDARIAQEKAIRKQRWDARAEEKEALGEQTLIQQGMAWIVEGLGDASAWAHKQIAGLNTQVSILAEKIQEQNEKLAKQKEWNEFVANNKRAAQVSYGLSQGLEVVKTAHEEALNAAVANGIAQVDALMAVDTVLDEQVEKLDVWKESWKMTVKELKPVLRDLAASVASDFAYMLGSAISAGESLVNIMKDLGRTILNALGDIMIYAGLEMGMPQGLPLVIGGLVAKLGAGILSGNGQDVLEAQTAKSTNLLWNEPQEFTIRGNVLTTAVGRGGGLTERLG